MGKRARKRGAQRPGAPDGPSLEGLADLEAALGTDARLPDAALSAPTSTYTDADGNALELRGSLTLKARQEYTATLHGGLSQDDALQRATELLFERLAIAWTIAGLRTDTQKQLLQRYRVATPAERQFIRDSLRAHAAESFPDLEAP